MTHAHREPWLSPSEIGDTDGQCAAAVDFGCDVTLNGDALLARSWRDARESVSSYGIEQYMQAFQFRYHAELDRLNDTLLLPITLGGEQYRRRAGAWERLG